MKKLQDYIIAYDISDHKRLSRIARYLEKVAFRIQYSIFLLPKASQKELNSIKENITKLINPDFDDVRIYTIIENGIHLGKAINLDEPFIFV